MDFWPTNLKDLSEIIKNAFTAIAIVIGGYWTLFRFKIFREKFSKMEFNLDYRFVGEINEGNTATTSKSYLIELTATLANKGAASQKVKDWTFNLRLFKEGDKVDKSDETFNYNVKFPHEEIKKGEWASGKDDLFIDGGTTQTYRYLTSIPGDTKFINIYSSFNYGNSKDDWQASSNTFQVEPSHNKSIAASGAGN